MGTGEMKGKTRGAFMQSVLWFYTRRFPLKGLTPMFRKQRKDENETDSRGNARG
jgi:hypothetical protein